MGVSADCWEALGGWGALGMNEEGYWEAERGITRKCVHQSPTCVFVECWANRFQVITGIELLILIALTNCSTLAAENRLLLSGRTDTR